MVLETHWDFVNFCCFLCFVLFSTPGEEKTKPQKIVQWPVICYMKKVKSNENVVHSLRYPKVAGKKVEPTWQSHLMLFLTLCFLAQNFKPIVQCLTLSHNCKHISVWRERDKASNWFELTVDGFGFSPLSPKISHLKDHFSSMFLSPFLSLSLSLPVTFFLFMWIFFFAWFRKAIIWRIVKEWEWWPVVKGKEKFLLIGNWFYFYFPVSNFKFP